MYNLAKTIAAMYLYSDFPYFLMLGKHIICRIFFSQVEAIDLVFRYHKHLKEFELRDASRRVAQNLPNVSYPIYPAQAYQPYSYYLPNTYRIDQFYAANLKRYKGGIYVSGGLADGDKSHEKK